MAGYISPPSGKAAGMQGGVELISRPVADAGLAIWRDVGRIERAERRRHGQPAGEQRTAGIGVAGNAVAGAGQIFAACASSAASSAARRRPAPDSTAARKRTSASRMTPSFTVRFAAARERHRQRALRHRRWIGRNWLRRQPGRDGGDIASRSGWRRSVACSPAPGQCGCRSGMRPVAH